MSDFMPGASVSRPIPRKETRPFVGSSGVAVYQMTEQEKQWAKEGKNHLIPTASARGIPYPGPEPRQPQELPSGARKRGDGHMPTITREMYQADSAAGLTINQIAIKYGISHSTVSNQMKKHGLHTDGRGRKRKERKGHQP